MSTVTYIAFCAGSYRALIPVEHVIEVLDCNSVSERPDANDSHATWRGRAIPALDMSGLLGAPREDVRKAIVLQYAHDDAVQPLLMKVDELSGVLELPDEGFTRLPMQSDQLTSYFDALYFDKEIGVSMLRLRSPAYWYGAKG